MKMNIILPRLSNETPFLTPSTSDLPSPAAANPSPSLSAQLSSPLPSKEHVLALLRPSPYARGHTFLRRQLPSVQRVIIQKIVIDWDGQLGDSYQDLWDWFIPSHSRMHTVDGDITVKRDSDAETDSNASVEGAEVAMSTYRLFASFLSKEERAKLHPLSLDFVDCLIPFLLRDHSLCDIYRHLFFNTDYVHGVGLSKVHNEWEEHTKVLFALLARSRTDEGRAEVYLSTQYARCQYLFFSSLAPHKDQQQLDGQLRKVSRTDLRRAALQSLLSKLLRTHKPSVHLFSLTISLPVLKDGDGKGNGAPSAQGRIWTDLPSTSSRVYLRRFLEEIDAFLSAGLEEDGKENETRKREPRAIFWFFRVIGELNVRGDEEGDGEEDWELLQKLLVDGSFSLSLARVIVSWISGLPTQKKEAAARSFLLKTITRWSSQEHLSHTSYQHHLYLTTLLLLLHSLLPRPSSPSKAISASSPFARGMANHLSSTRPDIRQCGLLVGEMITARESRAYGGGEETDGKGGTPVLKFGEDLGTLREVKEAVEGDLAAAVEEEEGRKWWISFLEDRLKADREKKLVIVPPPGRKMEGFKSSEYRQEPVKKPLIEVLNDSQKLERLESEDATLFQTLLPKQRNRTLQPPVYIADLSAYLRNTIRSQGMEDESSNEIERVELALEYGEGLVRRKRGWGELEENAVDLANSVLGTLNKFELEGFEEKKRDILIALVASCPKLVAPTLIEHYFLPTHSTASRTTILASLALGTRELAGFSSAPNPSNSHNQAKVLPENLHRALVDHAVSSVRTGAGKAIPEARRDELVSLSASSRSPAKSVAQGNVKALEKEATYHLIAKDFFLQPLLNRYWKYIRDMTTTTTNSSRNPPLVNPIDLKRFIPTLSILLYAAQTSYDFSVNLLPSTLELVLFLATLLPEEIEEEALECTLVGLKAAYELDQGRKLVRSEGGARRLDDVRVWAEEVFVREEQTGRKRGSLAAAVVLQVGAVFDAWREAS